MASFKLKLSAFNNTSTVTVLSHDKPKISDVPTIKECSLDRHNSVKSDLAKASNGSLFKTFKCGICREILCDQRGRNIGIYRVYMHFTRHHYFEQITNDMKNRYCNSTKITCPETPCNKVLPSYWHLISHLEKKHDMLDQYFQFNDIAVELYDEGIAQSSNKCKYDKMDN